MNEEQARRKLAAILSADAKDYSRLMEDDEEATVQTITAYREQMVSQIQNQKGRVVDARGDNLLAEFSSVVDAVRCAVEIQKELGRRNEELPEHRKMDFRIGVNLGDVIEEGETIYGDGVNIAARLEALAEGGGICISGTAFDQIRKRLSVGYEFLGEQEVKNIETPVRVYRVLTEPEAAGKVIGEERPKPKHWRWAILGGVAVLIILAGALAIWNFYVRPPFEPASEERMAFPLPDKPSIAVLPFDNLTGDPDQEYFSDGITEEIITALSKTPKLFVIARNSTFSYKGKPVKVKQVAEDLGVQYLLEGSVRKAEDQVRVTAQLIDALSGHHLWGESYDRDLKDIFAVQEDITKNIITALHVQLTAGEQARLSARGTANLNAYLKASEAMWYILQSTRDGLLKAKRLSEEAIALDPNYAPAYAALGAFHGVSMFLGMSKSLGESLKRAIELSQKAIALDDSLAVAHVALGYWLTMARQYDKAIAEGKRAMALAPSSASVIYNYASILMFAGRYEESIPLFKEALRLNPIPPNAYYRHFGFALRDSGRYEEAIAMQKKAIEQEPNDLIAHIALTSSYSLAGRDAEARVAAQEVLRLDPKFSLTRWEKLVVQKDRHAVKSIMDGLRKAGLPEHPPLLLPDKPSIAVLPFVNMSGDPEQEYFSDGITEEIITALSKTPRLFVIARTSSFKYKGKEADVRVVGRELGVRYVLEGSVRKSEGRVRITAQLVDAFKGHHLWAERYDRDLKDIFAVQDEITMKILTALQLKLTKDADALITVRRTKNLEVYLKYLEARALWVRLNPNDNALARRMIDEVIRMEPSFAPAYNLRAGIAAMDAYFGRSPRENFKQAFAFAKKAIALDQTLATAYFSLGFIYGWQRQHEKAVTTIEKGLTFEPSSAGGYFCLGRALDYAGRHEEGLEMLKRANRMDPFPRSYLYMHLGFAYCNLERYEEAIAALKKAIQIQSNNAGALRGLVASYSLAGREEDALIAAKELLRVNPNFSLERYEKISPYDEALRSRLIAALSKAGLK
ncbi:MAG: tetratricopeptide repeat protein [Desulfobacteraceae bacterium]|jgi:adenylate cyclase